MGYLLGRRDAGSNPAQAAKPLGSLAVRARSPIATTSSPLSTGKRAAGRRLFVTTANGEVAGSIPARRKAIAQLVERYRGLPPLPRRADAGHIAQLDRAADYGSAGRGFESFCGPHGSVAQPDRAPVSEAGGRWFESSRDHQIFPGRCQSGRSGLTVNQVALPHGGSNPPLPTNTSVRRSRVGPQVSILMIPVRIRADAPASNAQVAQSVERRPEESCVGGSNPSLGTISTVSVAQRQERLVVVQETQVRLLADTPTEEAEFPRDAGQRRRQMVIVRRAALVASVRIEHRPTPQGVFDRPPFPSSAPPRARTRGEAKASRLSQVRFLSGPPVGRSPMLVGHPTATPSSPRHSFARRGGDGWLSSQPKPCDRIRSSAIPSAGYRKAGRGDGRRLSDKGLVSKTELRRFKPAGPLGGSSVRHPLPLPACNGHGMAGRGMAWRGVAWRGGARQG